MSVNTIRTLGLPSVLSFSLSPQVKLVVTRSVLAFVCLFETTTTMAHVPIVVVSDGHLL